jgi:hypothetical protein
MKPCIKHTYHLVNNRYDSKGREVIEGEIWVTEKKCAVCGELFPQKEADKIKSLVNN